MFPSSRRAFVVSSVAALVGASACGVGVFSFGCGRDTDRSEATVTATPIAPPAQSASGDSDPRGKIVCLGDSLTAGLGLVETQSYPSLLQKKIDEEQLEFEVVNAGVSGDTSAGGLRRLDWILKEDVKVMVVALGGNDALRGLSVSEMKQNLASIIERAHERRVVVVVAGMQAPPNYGPEYATAFRAAFMDLARQYRTPFIPFLLDKVGGVPELNQPDGIHPNARGAEIVAETVWNALRPILQQMSAS
jgi:acyl-CoA thioesterase I